MIALDFSSTQLQLRADNGKTQIFDPVRCKWLMLTEEEHVRQHIIYYLVHIMKYPMTLIAVERAIKVGAMSKRFDIVIFGRDHKPWMLVECKAPEVAISENTLRQLLSYQRTVQCNYWLLTNGRQNYCADACDPQHISWLASLPAYPLGN